MRPFHQDHVYCSTEDKTGTGIGVLRAGSCVLAASDSLGFDDAEIAVFPHYVTICEITSAQQSPQQMSNNITPE
jgi:hypothetical protein